MKHPSRSLLTIVLAVAFASGCGNPPREHQTVEAAPQAVSVSPDSGSGMSETFVLKFSHPNGYKQLNDVRLLINAEALGSNACYVYYERPSYSLLLENDTTPDSKRTTLGSGKSMENSQCIVSTEGASVTGMGNDLTVTVPIKFKPAFAGPKKLILYAAASDGKNTDLVLKGQYTVQP